jgi:hypothetical protein
LLLNSGRERHLNSAAITLPQEVRIPIDFRAEQPFLQLIPIHRSEYDDEKLNNFTVHEGFDGLIPEDWQAFERTIVQPGMNPVGRRQGAYAVAARKRRAGEKRR